MRCVVPNCRNVSGGNGALSKRVTFHRFPKEQSLYMTWLKALKIKSGEIADTSFVCSEHFLAEDLYITKNGVSRVRAGAKPFIENMKITPESIKTIKHEHEETRRIGEESFAEIYDIDCKAEEKQEKLIDGDTKHNNLMRSFCTDMCDKTIDDKRESDENFTIKQELDIDYESMDVPLLFLKTEYDDDICQDDLNSADTFAAINNVHLFNAPEDGTVNVKVESYDEVKTLLGKEIINNTKCNDEDSSESHVSVNGENSSYAYDLKSREWVRTKSLPKSDGRLDAIQQEASQPKIGKTRGNSIRGVRKSKALIAITQSDKRPYSCDICSGTFKSQYTLKIHKKIHSENKEHFCQFCTKRFRLRNNLILHLRVHSSEKPFSCDICNKAFKKQDKLKMHLRVHTGEKPYSCNICNKKFSQSGDLKRHLRIHSGDKPYSCNVCKRVFTLNDHLQKHLKTHNIK